MSPRASTSRRAQRGVALLIALILVALAAILSTKVIYDGWLERRRTVGVIASEQALHFAMGAEALAADVISQTLQGANQVNLAQPWAQPTQPLPLTADDNPEGEPIGTLQGSLEDMSGRFNLNNLGARVQDPKNPKESIPDPVPLLQFQRLLQAVQLEPKWAGIARDWIDADDLPGSPDGAEDAVYTSQTPPYRTGNWPMMSPTELMNLPGFGADRYRKIAPYVTALPTTAARINICTASAPVLESLLAQGGEYTAQVLAAGRKAGGCFPDPTAFRNITSNDPTVKVTETTTYFRLTTRITLGTTEFTVYSLLVMAQNGKVTPLLRTFGTL